MTGPLSDLAFAAGTGPASAYAARLLRLGGARVVGTADGARADCAITDGIPAPDGVPWRAAIASTHETWASCGAMALTGEPDGPPRSPGWPVAPAMDGAAAVLALLTERLGLRVDVDGPALLGERGAHLGLVRRGAQSPSGPCRLLPCRDGWIALNLARPDDDALLAAWLQEDIHEGRDRWDFIADAVAERGAGDLENEAALLGLPVARLGTPRIAAEDAQARARGQSWPVAPWLVEPSRRPVEARTPRPLFVVDLSALWAGPLCAQLLGLAGARVVKVESTTRPDGARLGPASFFDLLHAGHESVALPLTEPAGRDALRVLLERADVVIDASRPRAMEQLDIDVDKFVRRGKTWVSVTGYGRRGPWSNRVGFGDDVAVAGGLHAGRGDSVLFCGDAIADPIAGLHAAIAAAASVLGGGGHLIDVSMRDAVASTLAAAPEPELQATNIGGDWVLDVEGRTVPVAPPRSRRVSRTARPFGADTHAVLQEVGAGSSWL